jgi:hypothetical protein
MGAPHGAQWFLASVAGGLFQVVQHDRDRRDLVSAHRLGQDQRMYMFWHHDVAHPTDAMLRANRFHRADECQLHVVVLEESQPPKTGDREEMNQAELVMSAKTTGHDEILSSFLSVPHP